MEHQRKIDLKWITQIQEDLKRKAANGFKIYGRGALVIDYLSAGQLDPPTLYRTAYHLPEADLQTQRLVRNYLPGKQMVVVVLQPNYLASSYQIGFAPPERVSLQ